ncbi:MAG: cupin domain-containing protein [Rhodospirillales bacterium]|nr:MAG: cupin domain-containing protein [Rhodospirillales bacterium]
MARVVRKGEAKSLELPGRISCEMFSGRVGAGGVTLRLVEIPVPLPDETPRPPHRHHDFEECIYVVSGQGVTHADSGEHRLSAGDAILIPPGESHVTRNTGAEPLVLLCFFPVADVAAGTSEPGASAS